jgi:hypothetical protein
MKKLTLLPFLLLFTIFSACKKDKEEPTPYGIAYFVFSNTVDGQPVQLGVMNYTNDAGNTYSIDILKYYISNMVFVRDDNSEVKAENYELIDESKSDSKIFSVSLPHGTYKKMRFMMGVDSLRNVSGAQSGDLDPINGMFWDWNTGYIYFKHEGNFLDTHNDLQPLTYHYGAIQALVNDQLVFDLPISAAPKFVSVSFNLNKVYRSPNVIDFNGNNIHSGDPVWLQTLKQNFPGAFEVTSVL